MAFFIYDCLSDRHGFTIYDFGHSALWVFTINLLIPGSKPLGSNLKFQLSNLANAAWYTLCKLVTTGVVVGVLAVVALVGWLIPQQSTPVVTDTTRQVWIATLPPWLQLWGEPLFLMGFSRLFQSVWFWGPLGLLLLNSLIALADYGPGAWQRFRKAPPSIKWQHPLAHRVEYADRLPDSPDQFLEGVKGSLAEKGFYLYESGSTDERIISAARRRWAWLGPAVGYTGLIVFAIALLVSSYLLQTDRFILLPNEPKSSALFAGEFELANLNSQQAPGEIIFRSSEIEQSLQRLTWRLYQPILFKQALILPTTIGPILTIEVRDAGGALLRLIPSQENLAPAEQLHLPLDGTNSPLYFSIPSAGLAFQIQPDPAADEGYQVQVRRGSESVPVTEINTQVGEVFKVNELSMTLSHQHDLEVYVHRDPALPLYLMGLILVVIAALSIFWQPPLQLWLVPEVKGRGGQLYSVIEKFGAFQERPPFLDQILSFIMKEEPSRANADHQE